MKAEERALELVGAAAIYAPRNEWKMLEAAIATAIREAVAAENAACEKLVWLAGNRIPGCVEMQNAISADIEARMEGE